MFTSQYTNAETILLTVDYWKNILYDNALSATILTVSLYGSERD